MSLRPRADLPRALHISAALASAAYISAVMPTRSLGTQGGQRAALCREEKGSNPTQSLCTAQGCSELALLDPIWDEGQSSAATTCQTPALGCLLICISRSDPASLSWSSMHSLRQPPHGGLWLPRGPSVPTATSTPCCATLWTPASLSPTCGTVQRVCASGRWTLLSGSTCASCEADSGSVRGVKGCLNCAAPPSNSGHVLCHLVKGGAASNGGPNLSMGAIAGISVAVIAVVGGLVGFLCWWFLCRGKA